LRCLKNWRRSAQQCWLLKENLDALDPSYKRNCKLAVFVLATYDPNGALYNSAAEQFMALSRLGYKVVFCEANSGVEALDAVRMVVEDHRNVKGKVSKGVSYIGLLSHSDGQNCYWGVPERSSPGSELSAALGDWLNLADVLAPDSPIISANTS